MNDLTRLLLVANGNVATAAELAACGVDGHGVHALVRRGEAHVQVLSRQVSVERISRQTDAPRLRRELLVGEDRGELPGQSPR